MQKSFTKRRKNDTGQGKKAGFQSQAANPRQRVCCGRRFVRLRGRRDGDFVGTKLAMEIPEGYAGLVFARSGLASKRGLAPANKVGVVDSDYRGEIIVALHNHGDEPQRIEDGERIAQIVVTPFLNAAFVEADSLAETERGEGGFGSTGRK